MINHKQILTKYYNYQERIYCYLGGYKYTILEQKLLEQITKIKILKEKRKAKKSYNDKVVMEKSFFKKKNFKLFHFDNFALTMTILPRKLVRQIFWFPKYTLYLHRELIDRICWVSIKESLNNFDFTLINNGSVNNCGFIEKGISNS